MLFGVAGGMADWLDIDPAIVRIVWALLIFAGGAGLLLYIVAAIVIPEEPLERAAFPVPMGATPAAGAAVVDGGAAGAGVPGDGASGEGSPTVDGPAAVGGSAMPAGAPPTAWVYPSRQAAREARRAERRAARGERQGNGVVILGVILVALGGWLLARMYLPFFDDRLVGPAFLVVIGIVLVITALNRPRQSPPS